MDHADPQPDRLLGGTDPDRASFKGYFPAVQLVVPVEDVHEGGLAGAVFSQEAVNAPLFDGEIYIVQGNHFPEDFADVFQFHQHLPLHLP